MERVIATKVWARFRQIQVESKFQLSRSAISQPRWEVVLAVLRSSWRAAGRMIRVARDGWSGDASSSARPLESRECGCCGAQRQLRSGTKTDGKEGSPG